MGSDAPKDVPVSNEKMDEWIVKVCDGIKTLLQKRQANYGNTIGSPFTACSKLGPRARAAVYIDQKLARLALGDDATAPDTLADVVGYAVLKRSLEYAQGVEFNDPLDLYIQFNATGDESVLERAARFAHDVSQDSSVRVNDMLSDSLKETSKKHATITAPIAMIAAMRELGIKVARSSYRCRTITIACPFHKDARLSCEVDLDTRTFRCDVCGENGSLDALLKKAAINYQRKPRRPTSTPITLLKEKNGG